MNQPESLPKFMVVLRRDVVSNTFTVTCEMEGDTREFRPSTLRFGSAGEVANNFHRAGLDKGRYKSALERLEDDGKRVFEVTLNEAQKLGVLHTETTE